MIKKTLLFLLSAFVLIFFHSKFYSLFDEYIAYEFLSDLKTYWLICLLPVVCMVQLFDIYRNHDKIKDAIFMDNMFFFVVYFHGLFFIPLLGKIVLFIVCTTQVLEILCTNLLIDCKRVENKVLLKLLSTTWGYRQQFTQFDN